MIDYEKLRRKWEEMVKKYPATARQIGPPNWLVKERYPNEDPTKGAPKVLVEDFGRLRQ